MLVLKRNLGESVIINGNIKINIGDVKGKQVKLAIEAPDDMSIHREEVHEQLKKEDKA